MILGGTIVSSRTWKPSCHTSLFRLPLYVCELSLIELAHIHRDVPQHLLRVHITHTMRVSRVWSLFELRVRALRPSFTLFTMLYSRRGQDAGNFGFPVRGTAALWRDVWPGSPASDALAGSSHASWLSRHWTVEAWVRGTCCWPRCITTV